MAVLLEAWRFAIRPSKPDAERSRRIAVQYVGELQKLDQAARPLSCLLGVAPTRPVVSKAFAIVCSFRRVDLPSPPCSIS
jgi:hypothetical protein